MTKRCCAVSTQAPCCSSASPYQPHHLPSPHPVSQPLGKMKAEFSIFYPSQGAHLVRLSLPSVQGSHGGWNRAVNCGLGRQNASLSWSPASIIHKQGWFLPRIRGRKCSLPLPASRNSLTVSLSLRSRPPSLQACPAPLWASWPCLPSECVCLCLYVFHFYMSLEEGLA